MVGGLVITQSMQKLGEDYYRGKSLSVGQLERHGIRNMMQIYLPISFTLVIPNLRS